MFYRIELLKSILVNISLVVQEIDLTLLCDDIELSADSKFIYLNESAFPIVTLGLAQALYHGTRCHFFKSVDKTKLGNVIATSYKFNSDFDDVDESFRTNLVKPIFVQYPQETLSFLQLERIKLINDNRMYSKGYNRLTKIYQNLTAIL